VETDGGVAHPVQERWRDIHRDNAAAADGIMTLRYSWSDIAQRPCHVAAQVARVLRRRGWRGTVHACGPACPIA
jgi:very-short-patch-repair endonuclease